MADGPRISIVTATLNRSDLISCAIDSVLAQEYPNFEHIVIDGGSTDGTLDVLARYPHLRVTSEHDLGVYDGMNKGIQLARGEWIGLLNSDDFYEKGAFASLVLSAMKNPDQDAFVGGAKLIKCREEDAIRFGKYSTRQRKNLIKRLTLGAPIINAWFFNRTIFSKLGLFSLDYKYAADIEFLIRFSLAGLKLGAIDSAIYCYRSHPGSLTFGAEQDCRMINEAFAIAEKYERHKETPLKVRMACRNWYFYYAFQVVTWMWRRKKMDEAVFYFRKATRYSLCWPLYYIAMLPIETLKYLARSIRKARN